MPLGVIAVVYEARPNVTIDAAALCLKSGNAIVLRGSATAAHSTRCWPRSRPRRRVRGPARGRRSSLVAGGGREELAELATQAGVVDLIIPRGGEGLKAALKGVATVPVIYAASGNCHVYVDAGADLDEAGRSVNAKVQRPGVCNAAETLLVHADVAPASCRRARSPARGRRRAARAPAPPSRSAPSFCLPPRRTGPPSTSISSSPSAVVDSHRRRRSSTSTTRRGHSEAIVTAISPRRGPSSSASMPPAST